MLRYLLDEHIPPTVVDGIRARRPEIQVEALCDWRNGALLAADDEAILHTATADGLTLVTFDLRTIPPLLRAWTEQGRSHSGVVFVHHLSMRPSDVGGLTRGLVHLWDRTGQDPWTDRVAFLRSVP